MFKRIVGQGLALFCCLLFAFSPPNVAVAANAPPLMTVSGNADVNANGDFTYSIPLAVPPGTAGLAPKLSVEYSSRNGDGALGLGWALQLAADSYARTDALKNPKDQSAPASGGVAASTPTTSNPASADSLGNYGGTTVAGAMSNPYPGAAAFDFPAPMTRCPRTVAQDGVHGSVNYDANDRFCLNGKRLILLSGVYGADGSQYRTEIDEFSKIIAHGQSGSGPAWFEVHTKSGQIFQFGDTTDSQALLVPVSGSTTGPTGTVRVWAVNKISDVQGNYLTVKYNNGTPDTTNGQIYPTEIDYTGNPNASPAVVPYNHVYFYYNTTQTRPDVVPTYQAGSLTQTTVLLTEIKTYTGSSLVYDYKLTYNLAENAATHDELNSITLCDANGACLAPTTFTWQGSRDRLAMTSVPVTLSGLVAPYLMGGQNFAYGDFNGDGLTDVSIISGTSGNNYVVNTQFGTSTAGSFGSPTTIYVPGAPSVWPISYPVNFNTLDINADGLADLYYYPQVCRSTGAYFYQSSGTGSFSQVGTAPCFNSSLNMVISIFAGGDFNGDSYADYFSLFAGGATRYVGNGAGNFSQLGALLPYSGASVSMAGDFDGDGCSDLLAYGLAGVAYSCNPAVSTTTMPSLMATVMGMTLANSVPHLPRANSQIVLGDFNGDGKMDVLVVPEGGPGTGDAVLYLSTGTGFAPAIDLSGTSTWYKYNVAAGDWNGDGKSDLILVAANGTTGAFYGQGTPHQLWLSTGTGFVQAQDQYGNIVTIANNSPQTGCTFALACIGTYVADWNNDGAQDVLLVQSSGGNDQYVFSYTPELISAISNGIGDTTNITYGALNQNGTFYTKCPGTPGIYQCGDAYPTQAVDGASYVVSRIDASNGLGTCATPGGANCYSTNYTYGGAKKDLSGRGSLGFQTRTDTDLQTGLVTTNTYQTAFPYTGFLTAQTIATTSISPGCASNVTIKSTSNTPGSVSLQSGTTRNFVYTSGSTVTSKDCNGAVLPTLTTTNQYDCQTTPTACYGELDIATLSRSDGSSQTTTRSYVDDTTDWCFGRPASTAINSIVGSSNITRTTTNQWTSCLLTQQVEEPGSSTLLLTSNYTPDVFGNVLSVAVSGSNIASRTTSATYDSLGQFPIHTTDAYGHVDTYAHDARFGGVTSHTDPNTVTTTWTYDTFGRQSNETLPDGTQTQFSYAYCAGVNGGSAPCPANGAFQSQALPTASNGAAQIGPLATTHYDMLSRNIANDTQGFDASTIRVSTPYDALGRIAQTSRPYFLSGGTPQWTVNTYDALGRVTLAVAPNTGQTSTVYNGLTVSVTNADMQTTASTKNAEGQVASVTDALSHTTGYVYDAFNNLTSITDPAGNVTGYTYDIRGHKLTSSDPDLGAWSYGYDALGEMTSQTDAKSQHVTLSYDLEQRMVSRVEPDLTSSWTYDTAAHGIDKLASAATTAGYQRALTYDTLSRPIQTALTEGGVVYNYATTYNTTNGQIATVTYPSAFALGYVYTPLGYVYRINDNLSGNAYWTVNARDAELHLTSQTFGNGVVQTNTFSSQTGLLTAVRSGSSNAVAAFDYTYDLLGDMIYRADDNQGVFERYCNDALNRLTASATGVSGVSPGTCAASGTNITDKSIAYDLAGLGNITSKSDVGTYSYPLTGQPRPHAVTSIVGTVNGVVNPTYSYDANGNMTGGAGRVITPTSYNMTSSLTQGATSIAFTYDSEHARIQQTGPAGTTTYLDDPTSGAMAEKVVNGASTSWNNYILVPGTEPGGGDLIGVGQGMGTAGTPSNWGSPTTWGSFTWSGPFWAMNYFTLDSLESVAVIANASASVAERDSYDAWGRRRNANGTDATNCALAAQTTRGFTGQEMMDAVCTVNLNARLYDPTIARFMAADPVTETPYDLQSLSRFAYVADDPVNKTDPTGNQVAAAAAAGCAADAETGCVPGAIVGAAVAGCAMSSGCRDAVSGIWNGIFHNDQAKDPPSIKPDDLKGKTADEIRDTAKDKGLVPDSKNPDKFRDPDTGKERMRVDPGHVDKTTGKPYDNPNAAGPHAHGYEPDGKTPIRDPETGDKHFPIKPDGPNE